MDREYKGSMYCAFFSELEELQRSQLAKVAGIEKQALNLGAVKGAVKGIGEGFKAWKATGLSGGLSQLGKAYRGAGGGWQGVKALAANPMAQAGALTVGGAGLAAGGAGYVAGRSQ